MQRIGHERRTVDEEEDEYGNANQERAQDLRTRPSVRCTTPGESKNEEDRAGDEEKDAYPVELGGLLHARLADMELPEGGRVVEELVEREAQDAAADAQEVGQAPAHGGPDDEGPGDDGAEDREGQRRQEDQGHDGATHPVRHQLAEHDAEGQLTRGADAVAAVGDDQHGDVLRAGAEDAADQREDPAGHDHPLAAEEVG